MRIVLPPDIQKMDDAVFPYLVKDGLDVHLSPSAPTEIVEMHKKVNEYWEKITQDYEKETLGLT